MTCASSLVQLLGRRQVGRRRRRPRDPAHLVAVGAGEPRDERRVRLERELVALSRARRRRSARRGTRRPCGRARRGGSARRRRPRARARRRRRRAGRRGRGRTAPARRGRRRAAGRRSGSSRPSASRTSASSSRGTNCATARSTETRSSVWTWVDGARRPGRRVAEPQRRARRAAAPSRARPARSRAAARRASRELVRGEHARARRASPLRCGPHRRTPRSSAFATPCRRPRGRTWTVSTCQRPGRRPHRASSEARRARSSSSARKTAPPPAMCSLELGPVLVPRLGLEPRRARAPRPRTPPRARGARPRRRRWRGGCSRHAGARSGGSGPRGSGTGRGAGRARARRTVEEIDRLAQGEVTGRPRPRPREVAREEPFGRPRPDPADGDRGGRAPRRRRSAASASRSSVGAREPDHVLGLPPREAERDELAPRSQPRPAPASGNAIRGPAALAEPLDRSGCGSRRPR